MGVIARYRKYLPVSDKTPVITLEEGSTPLIRAEAIAEKIGPGYNVWLKFEGLNPTSSFKDRGMTMAVSKALEEGSRAISCASTGNTSASAAAYAAKAGIKCIVVIPEGAIALGKLAQALIHGAKVIAVKGNFDQALEVVCELTDKYPVTLVNSINPYRIEGQKTAAFEVCDVLGKVPEYHALPVGNAGNITAYWKGYKEYKEAGVTGSLPRMLGFQAALSAPIVEGCVIKDPKTLATAIKIGNPVSWRKSLRGIRQTDGVVEQVSDQEIFDAKAHVDAAGIGAEPASCASVAGTKKLVEQGVIGSGETVCCILTGHLLKDPDAAIGYHRGELEGIESRFANTPVSVPARLDDVLRAIEED